METEAMIFITITVIFCTFIISSHFQGYKLESYLLKHEKNLAEITESHNSICDKIGQPERKIKPKKHKVKNNKSEKEDESFNDSFAIGYLTNDWVLGSMLGGDTNGAMLGDFFNDSDNKH